MKKFSVLVLLIILTGISCERDDICAASTPTTPHLIIRFYDINTQDQTKQVRLLSVIGEGMPEGNEIVFSTNTDSIVLPLRFQEEGLNTTTRFELKKDTDFDTDSNATTFSNTDILEIRYTPQFVYVSRACGYKSIFNDPQTTIEIDSDNWIFGSEILTTSIDNENEAHIILYH
ncbi:hypothetical protein NA63_2432 [Flavobacteriaceae bacterium MAR_2010_105]|nr:hypothetical protein NA63_2432 [Flavobacteriaceae bacterium MAR_2010_105]